MPPPPVSPRGGSVVPEAELGQEAMQTRMAPLGGFQRELGMSDRKARLTPSFYRNSSPQITETPGSQMIVQDSSIHSAGFYPQILISCVSEALSLQIPASSGPTYS